MKQIIAYLFCKRVDKLSSIDFSGIDYVNFSFGLVKDGKCYIPDEECLDGLLNLDNRQFKVALSIGGWGADGFSDAVLTDASRKTFVDSIIKIVKEKNLDGVDIDWEYPCMDSAGIKARPEDKENFTLFMELLRKELDKLPKQQLLTFAVGASRECASHLELDKLANILDYLNLMTYDMGSSHSLSFSHHTNLYPSKYSNISALETVEIYNKFGFPKEKMILGSAFYGKVRPLKKDVKPSRWGYPFKDIDAGALSEYKYFFDEDAKAPIYYNDDEYVSFDNIDSVKEKCKFIRENKLAGIMFWELSSDNGNLVKTMFDNLK